MLAACVLLCSGAVVVDRTTGGVQSVLNRLTGRKVEFRDEPFRLTSTAGEYAARDCKMRDGDGAVFRYTCGPLAVELRYEADETTESIRKRLNVTNAGPTAVTLFRVAMFDWTIPSIYPSGYAHSYYPAGIHDIHFHKSGMWYDHSINLFLRDEVGGMYLGVENPYFEANSRALGKVYPATVELSYRPNVVIRAGETFEGDAGFFGTYRHEGIYSVAPAREYFSGRERRRFEVLDQSEVWAMQAYMRRIMPLPKSPGNRYYMAYWGMADPGRLGAIARKQKAGEALTAEEAAMLHHFNGVKAEGFDKNELWFRLTPETLKFYRMVVDDAARLGGFQTLVVPNMMAGRTGWFRSADEKADSPLAVEEWFSGPAYRLWQQLADYAATKGLGMFSLELAGRGYRKDRPEWKYQDENGKRTGANCYANREYADWYTEQVDRALTAHPLRQFQWDEGWMDVLRGMIGLDATCYDTAHGHPAGNVSYAQFRNVQKTLARLKSRHPESVLVIISGLIRGMPWLMRDLDADSHTGSMERSAWTDHNVYFLPPSRSHRQGGVHWILDNRSAGEEPSGTGNWYQMLENPERFREYAERWHWWTDWASRNRALLEHQRDLFNSPLAGTGLQGTTHADGGRAVLFLHNPTGVDRTGEVVFNSWLGLEERARFRIHRLFPRDEDAGVYAWGDTLRFEVPHGQTVALELVASAEPLRRETVQTRAGTVVERAFLRREDLVGAVTPEDLWPTVDFRPPH